MGGYAGTQVAEHATQQRAHLEAESSDKCLEASGKGVYHVGQPWRLRARAHALRVHRRHAAARRRRVERGVSQHTKGVLLPLRRHRPAGRGVTRQLAAYRLVPYREGEEVGDRVRAALLH